MATASGNYDARPPGDYGADVPLTDAQVVPAMKELSRGFASIFPGKTVDDLTTATKWTHEEIRKVVDFVPPKGGGEKEKADIKKNGAALATLKNLTKGISKNGKGMDLKELHGILKNFDTMQEVVSNIQKEIVANPKELQALLKTDDKLKEFLVKQMNTALDTRYKGKGFTKEMTGKAAKKQFTSELNDRNQKVLKALKIPLLALQAATKAPIMQAFQAKLPPIQVPQLTVTLKPETAATPESSSRSAAGTPTPTPPTPITPGTGSPRSAETPSPKSAPATPQTPNSGGSLPTRESVAALYAQYGFVTRPPMRAISAPQSAAELPSAKSAAAQAAPQPAAKPKSAEEIMAKDIKDYSRAFVTVQDSIEKLAKLKPGMKKPEDQKATDAKIQELKEQIKKLQNNVFKEVSDTSVLKNLSTDYYKELADPKTPESRKEICQFLISAIDKRLIDLYKLTK